MSVPVNIFTLKQTAEILSVSVDTLLEWNNNNILKPTITPNGGVGYTQEQIVKFLAIRQLSQNTRPNFEEQKAYQPDSPTASETLKSNSPSADSSHSVFQENYRAPKPDTENKGDYQKNTPANNPLPSSDWNTYHRSKAVNSSKINDKKPLYIGIVSTFSILIAALLAIPFLQQNIRKPSLNQYSTTAVQKTNNTRSLSDLEVNEAKYFEFSSPPLEVLIKNKNIPEDNLNKTNFTASENILATSSSIFTTKPVTTETNVQNHISAFPLFGEKSNKEATFGNNPIAEGVNDTTVSNYASRPNCPTCFKNTETTMLDENGNIKGETTNTDLLATTLGTIGSFGIVQKNNLLGQTINPGFLTAFLALSILPIVLIFKKQPVYNGKSNASSAASLNPTIDLQKEKVLELDQKTDGTVVLYFQGKEHKISKPELNSESDQFIERLLSFTAGDVKEINYDISKDEKIILNAPLSKLVTRLGFVSLRRDLFFPRTSKNRVLFRKYLTHQDLVSMGITADRLLNELTC